MRDNSVSDYDLYKTPEYKDRGTEFTADYDMSVRETPSKSGKKLDKIIKKGESVTVYETETISLFEKWGRIGENEWFCLLNISFVIKIEY